MLKKTILYFFLIFFLPLKGQDSILFTKNFLFEDGIYLTQAELRANRPAYRLEEVNLQFFTNPQTSLTQVQRLERKADGQLLYADSILALALDGIPFIRVPAGEIKKDLPTFAALKLRGKICYYTYPDWRKRKVAVSAYNPVTGRPFRQGVVEREEEVIVEKMMCFETGETVDFTLENFLNWISDDEVLLSTYQEMTEEEQREKMFKGLLIYVDRNAFYLKK